MDSSASRIFASLGSDDAAGDAGAGELVPRRCTLGGFAAEVAIADGLDVCEAEPLVPILVTTRNSVYRIIPLRRGSSDVLVQGGALFPQPARARLAGSTFGGSFLKMHWIAVGMRMEIDPARGGGPVVTTRVASVRITSERTANARPQ